MSPGEILPAKSVQTLPGEKGTQAGLTYWGCTLQATLELGRQWLHVDHIWWKGVAPDVLQGKVCNRTRVVKASWYAHAFDWRAKQAPVGSSKRTLEDVTSTRAALLEVPHWPGRLQTDSLHLKWHKAP